jgi:hypothetical protein
MNPEKEEPMTNPDDRAPDDVAGLADRLLAKQRRGEEPGLEFEIDFASLTALEQDEFLALLDERTAHGEERLEALVENVRILQLLFTWHQGTITTMEFVERIRGAVPDPLAEQLG